MDGSDVLEDAVEISTSAAVSGLPCLTSENYTHSYFWHSIERYIPPPSIAEQDEPFWILGIDEAGRGPVLGALLTKARTLRR